MAKAITKAQSDIRYGAIWFVGGLVVTFGTHILARDGGGGPYVIAYGPVIFGAFKLAKGVVSMLFGNDEIDPSSVDTETKSNGINCPSCIAKISTSTKYCQICGRALGI